MKTAVVILNYNGRHYLEKFLPDVIKFSGSADVIVADNASTDDSVAFLAEHYPELRLIVLDKNYGFAEGYNKALSQVDSEYFVLLNSDVLVTPNWLTTMESYLDSNVDIAAVQPKILSYSERRTFEYAGAAGGFIDKYGYPFCRGRIFDTVETDNGQYDDVIDVTWASGACLMIRAAAFREAGGLDGRFFAYQEEIDLCWRLRARGQRIVCMPRTVVYHVGSGVLGSDSPLKTYLNFRNNLFLLYKNMQSRRLRRVLIVRWFLDYAAALQFFLSGKSQNAKSVFKARRDFARDKHLFADDRRDNIAKTVKSDDDILAPFAVLWQYYSRGKKTFDKCFPIV